MDISLASCMVTIVAVSYISRLFLDITYVAKRWSNDTLQKVIECMDIICMPLPYSPLIVWRNVNGYALACVLIFTLITILIGMGRNFITIMSTHWLVNLSYPLVIKENQRWLPIMAVMSLLCITFAFICIYMQMNVDMCMYMYMADENINQTFFILKYVVPAWSIIFYIFPHSIFLWTSIGKIPRIVKWTTAASITVLTLIFILTQTLNFHSLCWFFLNYSNSLEQHHSQTSTSAQQKTYCLSQCSPSHLAEMHHICDTLCVVFYGIVVIASCWQSNLFQSIQFADKTLPIVPRCDDQHTTINETNLFLQLGHSNDISHLVWAYQAPRCCIDMTRDDVQTIWQDGHFNMNAPLTSVSSASSSSSSSSFLSALLHRYHALGLHYWAHASMASPSCVSIGTQPLVLLFKNALVCRSSNGAIYLYTEAKNTLDDNEAAQLSKNMVVLETILGGGYPYLFLYNPHDYLTQSTRYILYRAKISHNTNISDHVLKLRRDDDITSWPSDLNKVNVKCTLDLKAPYEGVNILSARLLIASIEPV